MFGLFKNKPEATAYTPSYDVKYTLTLDTTPAPPRVVNINDLPGAYDGGSGFQYSQFTGDKFAGGFGLTELYNADYWTLRKRSSQLFKDNLYARGLIRRLITNEINTGLTLDCTPAEELIPNMSEDEMTEWAERVERAHNTYMEDPRICDYKGKHTGYQLERFIRREALIEGDILVVLKFDPVSGQDKLQLIPGSCIVDPLAKDVRIPETSRIEHGVELDAAGRHTAFYIEQQDGTVKRQPAFGNRSGRLVAWMVYGNDMRYGETRGEPLLSILLQSLKEIDRYRDAAQRKAVINSLLAMYVTKEYDKPGSRPLTAATGVVKSTATRDENNPVRRRNFATSQPGIVLDELQQGEDIKAFRPDGTDINFAAFESAIVVAIAWANEMPPEILQLQFSNNYSASQAAINEFKMYLTLARSDFSAQLLKPWYRAFLYNELIAGRLTAPGLLEIWNDTSKYQLFNAWLSSDWTGAIKPSTDLVKQAKGYKMLVDEGWITNEKASKELTGTNFRQNMKRIKQENLRKAEAMPNENASITTEE